MSTEIRFEGSHTSVALMICKKALIKEGYTVADYPDNLLVIEKISMLKAGDTVKVRSTKEGEGWKE